MNVLKLFRRHVAPGLIIRNLITSPVLDLLSRHITADLQTAAENAVLRAFCALGLGDKELVDWLASDAIRGSLETDCVQAKVVNGEGQKDKAPGIFRGEILGNWRFRLPYVLALALDPVDGTTNAAFGRDNSGCYIAGILTLNTKIKAEDLMVHLPADRCWKLAVGEHAAYPRPIDPEAPVAEILRVMSLNSGKEVKDLVVVVLNRDYNAQLIKDLEAAGCKPELVQDGDIAPIVAACMPHNRVDAYIGIGGTPEAQIAAAAVHNLHGVLWVRQWAKTEEETRREGYHTRLLPLDEIVHIDEDTRTIFVAAGLTDSSLLKGVKKNTHYMLTHTLTVRSRTMTLREIITHHHLLHKRIYLFSRRAEVRLGEK